MTGKGSGLPNRYILHATEGWGKCLGKGTPVLMFDGTVKPVEQVEEGDLLMGPDSRPRRVTGLHSGHGPLFRIAPNTGVPYVVNWKHILSLKISGRNRGDVLNIPVCELGELKPSARKAVMGWRAAVNWPEQDQPIDPYLFGCWLGDGTAVKPDITTPEPEVRRAMEAYAGAHGMAVRQRAEAGKAATLAITTERSGGVVPNAFTDSLKDLGVFGNKHIPWIYKAASKEQRMQLLAGITDTDGYLYGNCFDLTLKSEQLAEDVVFVARSLGFCATVVPCQKTCMNNGATGTYYRFKISGHTNLIPNRVPRKKADPRGARSRDPLVTGITVEPIGDGEFFGFEVDGDHLFLLGDFTVTHNTSFGAHTPKPIFIQTGGETGLETLIDAGRLHEVPHFPAVQSWDDLLGCVETLTVDDHPFRTLVMDTLNGGETLCHQFVCARDFNNDWGNKGFGSYNKGFDVAVPEWTKLLVALDRLRIERKMTIFLLCHTKVKPFKNPEGPDYDRYQPDVHEKTWGVSHKWADCVLFGNFEITVQVDKVDSKKGKGTGGAYRLMFTERHAAYDAKNRLGLPSEIEMGDSAAEAWQNFMAAVKAGRGTQPQPEQQQPTQEVQQ